jgi:hypothetical protein
MAESIIDLFHFKGFAGIVKGILRIYHKYVRDRRGGHLAPTTGEYSSIEVRVTGTHAASPS